MNTMNKMNTISGKIIERKEITADIYELIIKLNEAINYKPGQFMMIHFPHEEHNSRAYSILRSSENGKHIHFGIRQERQISKRLREAEIGTELVLQGPMGTFTLVEEEKPLVFIAAGIGITAIFCLLQEIQKRNWKKTVHLFYSSSTEKNTAFLNELEALDIEQFHLELFLTKESGENSLSKTYGRRMKLADIQKKVASLEHAELYLCGPVELVTDIKMAIKTSGIPRRQLHSEEFYSRV